MDEKELFELFAEDLREFEAGFWLIAPFGRAGSDEEFREIVEAFQNFVAKWDPWYKKHFKGDAP